MHKSWFAIAALVLVAGAVGYLLFAADEGVRPERPAPAAAVATPPPSPAPRAGAAPTAPVAHRSGAGQRPTGADPVTGDHWPDQADVVTDYTLPALFHVKRGLARPDARPGEPVTAEAMKRRTMSDLEPEDEDHDPVIEAHQLFNAFEMAILAQDPLTREAFEELQAAYAPAKEAMEERSVAIAQAGFPDKTEELLLEWQALEFGYEKLIVE